MFVNHCQLATCDDLTLMEGFWCGLVEDIRLVMRRADPCWSLKSYINFALWIAGSSFIVGETESSARSSHVAATPQSGQPAVPLLSSASSSGYVSNPITLQSAAPLCPLPFSATAITLPSAAPLCPSPFVATAITLLSAAPLCPSPFVATAITLLSAAPLCPSPFVAIAIHGLCKPASHRKPTYRCSCAPGLVGGI